MVPFDVMTGRNCMVCNSRGVADLCKSFEMLGLPVMQSSFCFADVEGITVPTTGFVYTAASFLHFLNTRHPNIKFTMELEENQEIPFLDVRIKRNLNNFTTTVHRKTTFTGLYTK